MEDADLARRELARRELVRRSCAKHPGLFLQHVSMPDEREADVFRFRFAPEQTTVWETGQRRQIRGDEEGLWLADQLLTPAYYKAQGLTGWEWQGDLLDFWELHNRTLDLKARQIGVTWLRAGRGLWRALYRPGSNFLVYRQKEDDAAKIVKRMWAMLQSVPPWMWNGASVMVPARGGDPSTLIELGSVGRRRSTIRGMASAAAAGHGETAAEAMADEFAHVQADLAPKIIKAAGPAVGKTGSFGAVSTANGRSDEEGNGNYFHYLWVNGKEMGFHRVFHPWWMHPDRDQDWYDNDPEVLSLRWFEKAEQYPANAHEAFTLTNRVWFDRDALRWYAENAVRKPLYGFEFEKVQADRARVRRDPEGLISLYEPPVAEGRYAVGADVATGRGKDYSAAYVVNLQTMGLVAELHAKVDPDRYAYQLHYLGRLYNTALIAVEMGGGYGEPVLLNLRDGKDGRPAYPRLYRHTERDRPDTPLRKTYGFPMTQKTRPQIVSTTEKALREKSIPWLTDGLLFELENFVAHEHGTSPRAAEGLNDDRVMAFAITLELYRQFGHHPDKPKRKPRPQRIYQPLGR